MGHRLPDRLDAQGPRRPALPEDGTIIVKAGYPPEDTLEPADLAAARWAWENDRPAGRDADTLPGAKRLFLPVRTARGPIGVAGIDDDRQGPLLTPERRRLIDALIDQAALAIERVKLVEDLDNAKLAAETDRLRSALLTSISHDLRTPLASIIGAASMMKELSPPLDEAAKRDMLGTVLEEAERLNRFIANLLDMTRLESGAIRPNLRAVDVDEVVGTALGRARKLLPGRQFEVAVPVGLPAVRVDPVLLEQVFFNLLDNAGKYADAEAPIRIQARADGDETVTVEVLDEGPGIEPQDLERVFGKFTRLEKGDSVRAGHRARPGDLPRLRRGHGRQHRSRQPRRPTRRRLHRQPAGRPAVARGDRMSASPVKILVVDDEPPIRKLLRVGLTAQGYSVIEAVNGRQALEKAKDEAPDLIVLDLGLPDIPGQRLLTNWREDGNAVPVLILSSRADEAGIVEALELGADDYVTKPFGVNELSARIRVALRHRLQQQGEHQIFKTGELSVDLVRRIVKVADREVKLSPKEYDILRLLVQHAGKVLTHNFLLRQVWGDASDPQYLRVYVGHLRQKMEPSRDQPRYILTETGVGYRLLADE